MIIDDIKNISKYPQIPVNIADFLIGLSAQTPEGHYEIDENNFVNVDVYSPKPHGECRFEAHKKYIDVQMILSGEEEIDIIPTEGLQISEPYDENRDVMFFEPPLKQPEKIIMQPFKFVLIYPHEAHRPQIKTSFDTVKKAVAKIICE